MGLALQQQRAPKTASKSKLLLPPICKEHAVVRKNGGRRLTSIISTLEYRDKERHEVDVLNFWILVPIFGCLILKSCLRVNHLISPAIRNLEILTDITRRWCVIRFERLLVSNA